VRAEIVLFRAHSPDRRLVLVMTELFRLGTVSMRFVLLPLGTDRLSTTSSWTRRARSSTDRRSTSDRRSSRAHPGTSRADTRDMTRNPRRELQSQRRTTSTRLDQARLVLFRARTLCMWSVRSAIVLFRAHMVHRLFVLCCSGRLRPRRTDRRPGPWRRCTRRQGMPHRRLGRAETETSRQHMTSTTRNRWRVDIDRWGKRYRPPSQAQRPHIRHCTGHSPTVRVELELFRLDKQSMSRVLSSWRTDPLDKEYMPWRRSELLFGRSDRLSMTLVRTEPARSRVDRASTETNRCWASTNRERMTHKRQDQGWTSSHQERKPRTRTNRAETDTCRWGKGYRQCAQLCY
jgi:hypothetical protein